MIKGKPLGDKFMERAQMVGFVLLLSLMVFVLGNDIFKAIMH
jgi:regulator of sigma E protease